MDVLREEHREKLRKLAEEAERQRQMQMAHKLDIMRKKKQEYLQYQRQLALQKIQEQEREMQMRQEQQKQQYIMGPQFGFNQNSPAHTQYPVSGQQYNFVPHFQPMMQMPGPGLPIGIPVQHMMGPPTSMHGSINIHPAVGPNNPSQMESNHQQQCQAIPPGQQQITQSPMINQQNVPNTVPNSQAMGPRNPNIPNPQQLGHMTNNQNPVIQMHSQGIPMGGQQHVPQAPVMNQGGINMPPPIVNIAGQSNMQFNPQGAVQSSAPPGSPQTSTDTQTAELISFD